MLVILLPTVGIDLLVRVSRESIEDALGFGSMPKDCVAELYDACVSPPPPRLRRGIFAAGLLGLSVK